MGPGYTMLRPCYKVTPPLHHPKNNFMSKQHLIQPLRREIYNNPWLLSWLSPRFSSGAKIFGNVSHATELVCMCLACQHFDFNSADWVSDNLHVISSWYLLTMGNEFVFQFSRCSWGRNVWRTPKNVCVGGWWYQGTAWSGGIREILLLYPVVSRYSTIWFLWYNRDAVSLSYGIKIQHDLVSTV